MTSTPELEICVDDAAGLKAAREGWANRIELCSALQLGGLTPSAGLMELAVDCPLPVYAMIRPRAGDFVYGAEDLKVMLADIEAAGAAGLDGVVIGANRADGRLDETILRALVKKATGLGVTLHRAFDLVPDFAQAIELALDLGVERILTSGGAPTAIEGIIKLRKITALAKGRISIMPGSGVDATNAKDLLALPGVNELHASGSVWVDPTEGTASALGFATRRKITDVTTIRTLKHAMSVAARPAP